jgi:hypothetical protein
VDFRTIFRVTGGYLKAGTSFLNRVKGRIFRISKRFFTSNRNTILIFPSRRQSKIVPFKKVLILFLGP